MSVQPISHCSTCFAPEPIKHKTYGEIIQEKNQAQAEKAKSKPREERTFDDKIAIVADGINKLTTNVPVVHANKLNYLG